MACALQCSACNVQCLQCVGCRRVSARLARCFAPMRLLLQRREAVRAVSMLLQLAVLSSAAGCDKWSFCLRLAIWMHPLEGRYGRIVSSRFFLLRTGFLQPPRRAVMSQSLAIAAVTRPKRRGHEWCGRGQRVRRGDGVVANGVEADGAIVNYGDIKLVLCDTPPPRRLLHQQVAARIASERAARRSGTERLS